MHCICFCRIQFYSLWHSVCVTLQVRARQREKRAVSCYFFRFFVVRSQFEAKKTSAGKTDREQASRRAKNRNSRAQTPWQRKLTNIDRQRVRIYNPYCYPVIMCLVMNPKPNRWNCFFSSFSSLAPQMSVCILPLFFSIFFLCLALCMCEWIGSRSFTRI